MFDARTMNYFKHLQTLGPLPRHINSPSYDFAASYLAKEYDLEIIKLDPSQEVNGWIIPPKYSVSSAFIKSNDGNIVWDGLSHPLSVISYSSSVNKTVSNSELKEHCYFDHRSDHDIPYHFRQSYRPWERDWGFCMDKKTYDSLIDDSYQVHIDIFEGKRELVILEGETNPNSNITFILAAHLDHPGLVNDDLTGVIAACEVFKRMPKNTGFNVKILLLPEIIGAELYLHGQDKLTDGLFIESIGIPGSNFFIQKPKILSSSVPGICEKITEYDIQCVPFRNTFGNDEANFEAFGCPMVELNKGYFPEYHTHKDNIDLINEGAIEEAVLLVKKIIEAFMDKTFYIKKFKGTICCSNPKLNLYIEPGQPAFGTKCDSTDLRSLMDAIPFMPEQFSLDEITTMLSIDESIASAYLDRWCEEGLLTKLA